MIIAVIAIKLNAESQDNAWVTSLDSFSQSHDLSYDLTHDS